MASPAVIKLTKENFAAEVLNSGVPVLVDFWAEWCGPCKMLGPILDEIATDKGATVKIGKVNVDVKTTSSPNTEFSPSLLCSISKPVSSPINPWASLPRARSCRSSSHWPESL